MGRPDRLTPVEEARLTELREEWREIGLATGPADRLRAERGMRLAYAAAGLPQPRLFLWTRSPLEGVLGTTHLAVAGGPGEPDASRRRLAAALRDAYLDLAGQPGAWGRAWAPPNPVPDDRLTAYLASAMLDSRAVRQRVARRLPNQVGRAVRGAVGPRAAEQVRREVQDDVRWHLVRRLWAPVVAEIQTRAWQRLRGRVEDHHGHRRPWVRPWSVVRDLYRLIALQEVLHAPVADRATPDWLAAYDFFGRACGVREVERLRGLMELTRAAAWWWWPQRGAVVLSERPERIRLDDQGRLHDPRGPALAYRDGWSIWAWHGVRVSREVIERPETLTAQQVLAETDVEARRVMIERIGHERLVRDGGARRVAEDGSGILWRLDLLDDEPLVCVEVTDASPGPDAAFRRYLLRVPPGMRSPREAVAWTFGIDSGEYLPAIES